jgi:steroid delta-isomerase-like uncharacterized protein
MMTTQQAFEVGTAAFNAHDFDAFAAVLADDVRFEAPGGARLSGKQACVEFYRGWIGAFPDAQVEVDAVHHVDDRLIVEEGTFTGTHDGALRTPGGDIPATGRSVSIPYIHVLRFREGKHVFFGLMFDRLQMLEQLGIVPGPTATPAGVSPPADFLSPSQAPGRSPQPHPRLEDVRSI